MPDLNAIRRHTHAAAANVDTTAIRSIAKIRAAGRRPAWSNATTEAIQRHAEAIGRGEPSISPVNARIRRTG